MRGVDFAIFLHSHMPYVRHNGDWPCGEQWLLEAWAESYLPLWKTIEDITSGLLPGKLALTMTPVLAEQLRDEYLQERLIGYLRNRVSQAGEEVARLKGLGDETRAALAARHEGRLNHTLREFEHRFRGRMLDVLAEGMDSGRVEVLASAATHSHLPSLGRDACRVAQLELGVESYRRHFQRDPSGLWIPECSYTPELDGILDRFSPPLSYVILDFRAVESAPEDAFTWEPRLLGDTSLVALLRDVVAHDLVWTIEGIPSHSHYRDYMKRDHDGYGFHYWRITSLQTPLDEKAAYDPGSAEEQAREDARKFVNDIERRRKYIEGLTGGSGPAVIMAGYDTELLGHWWLEGPIWLREVCAIMADGMELPRRVVEKTVSGPRPTLSPQLTSWCLKGDFSTWINPRTSETWTRVHAAEERFLDLVNSNAPATAERKRALAQAARELLLAESSDWTFMITRGKAGNYARERLGNHLNRFHQLERMLEGNHIDMEYLANLEDSDNLFPDLDLDYWRI
ncbi:MAG: 1,4-alpha-glucan branching protein domain-containing protein [Actinomycetota bacterium]|nr:1,4-alpha-glucan branching protein domain-containing protein [Actinomycetota bacterium]